MEKYLFSDAERSAMEKSPIPFGVYQNIDGRVVSLAVSQGYCDLFGCRDPGETYADMDKDVFMHTHRDDLLL